MTQRGDVYYPQCWVRLRLRFEDFVRAAPPDRSPAVPDTDPVDYGFVLIDEKIIPTNCSVTRNSYRNADEARITIPYGRLPIDPRWLRACAVQVFMGTLDPGEYARGIGPIYGESRTTLIPESETEIEDAELSSIQLVDGELVRTTKDGTTVNVRSNEVFRGYVDDWEASQDGDDAVSITCRDITAVLIDANMPTGGLSGIPKDLAIDEVIREIIVGEPDAQITAPTVGEDYPRRIDARTDSRRLQFQISYLTKKIAKLTAAQAREPTNTAITSEIARLNETLARATVALVQAQEVEATTNAVPILARRYGLPALRGLRVTNATGAPLPTLAQVKGATYFDSKGNAKRSRSGGSNETISYWDFVTDICVGAGFICYFRTPTKADRTGTLPPAELVIDLPKTYYPNDAKNVREFVYGYNVDSVSISRSFTGRNVPTGVAVSAIEADTGEPISTKYPPDPATNRATANAEGLGDRSEYLTILLKDRIPGSLDGRSAQQTLNRIAESIYQQLGRGEFLVNIETTALAGFRENVGTGRADLFQLQAGDPIETALVPSISSGSGVSGAFVTQAGNFEALGLEGRARALVEVYGFSDEAAALAAGASESDKVQRRFYVRTVGIDFDATSGFKFSIEAINYLDARNAVDEELAGADAALELLRRFNP